jgi:hypothetical protein
LTDLFGYDNLSPFDLNELNLLSRRNNSMHSHRIALFLIALLYCALTFAYAVLTPPWESPDEPAHYRYAAELAARWCPPVDPIVRQRDSFCRDYAYVTSNYEWFQPALGYLPAAVVYKALEILAPNRLPREMPPFNPQFCPNAFVYHNLFLHANLKVLEVWRGNWGVLVLRITLSLMGLVVIYAAYRTGRIVEKDGGWLGIAAAGWIAFLPQFTFINANVRSDTFTNAIAALVFLIAALMQTSTQHTKKYSLCLGVLLGIGLLSKYTFIYMVLVGWLAVILTAPRSPRTWFLPFVYITAPIVILVGAYHLAYDEARVALVYTFTATLQLRPDALTWHYVREIPKPLLIDLFFARFGWANVTTPETWSRLAFGMWGIGACITLVQAGRSLRKPEAAQSLKIIVLLGVGMLLAFGGVVRYNLSNFSPQGRYLFPALVPYAIFGFWGIWQMLPARGRIALGITANAFMFAFNLYALFFALIPAYY